MEHNFPNPQRIRKVLGTASVETFDTAYDTIILLWSRLNNKSKYLFNWSSYETDYFGIHIHIVRSPRRHHRIYDY